MRKGLLLFFLCALYAVPVFAGSCSPKEIEKAKELKLLLQDLADRQIEEEWVVYHWKMGWYLLDYEMQYRMSRACAGAERCLGDAKRPVYIHFLGEDVARADGVNMIRVIKSKP